MLSRPVKSLQQHRGVEARAHTHTLTHTHAHPIFFHLECVCVWGGDAAPKCQRSKQELCPEKAEVSSCAACYSVYCSDTRLLLASEQSSAQHTELRYWVTVSVHNTHTHSTHTHTHSPTHTQHNAEISLEMNYWFEMQNKRTEQNWT